MTGGSSKPHQIVQKAHVDTNRAPIVLTGRSALGYHATVCGTFAANKRSSTSIVIRPSVGCVLLPIRSDMQRTVTTCKGAFSSDGQQEETCPISSC